LADHPLVKDVRNFGLMGAVELESRPGAPGARGMEVHKKCYWEQDLVLRNGMDTLQFSPFLNSRPDEMTQSFEKIRAVLDQLQ
jgi:beta-alanine--pyruvate transaminase